MYSVNKWRECREKIVSGLDNEKFEMTDRDKDADKAKRGWSFEDLFKPLVGKSDCVAGCGGECLQS